MSQETNPPAPPRATPARRRSRWPLWLGVGGGVAMLAVLLAAESLYLARRSLGREAAIGWLRERGVEADVDVKSLDLDGFTGRIRIGPAANPQVVVERAEVSYRLLGFWNGHPLGVEVGEVRLVRPTARASLRDGRFSMGSLDRLIDEFRQRPPQPDARQPKVTIEGGRFILTTDYGLADLRGDARLEDGRLLSLSAGLAPTSLKVGDLGAVLRGGRLSLTTQGDRVAFNAQLAAERMSAGQVGAEGLRVALVGALPYPDMELRRGDGQVAVSAQATAESVATPGVQARDLAWDGRFDGDAKGWIDSLNVDGRTSGVLSLGEGRAGDLAFTRASLDVRGPIGFDAQDGFSARLDAALRGRGAWAGLGAPAAADDPTIAAFKRFAGGFDLSAPGLTLLVGQRLVVEAARPVRIAGASGEATVGAVSGAPLFDSGSDGGGLRLSLRGRDLPTVTAVAPRYALTASGVTAQASLAVQGSLGPLREAKVDTSGRLTVAGGAVAFAPSGCADLTLARLELGANDVEALAGALCPNGAPLLTLADGAWRLRARAERLSAAAPFLEARVTEGEGTLDLGGEGEAFNADMVVTGARVTDAAAQTRFNPVRLTGVAASRDADWSGRFTVADLAGRPLATADLTHAGASGRGGVAFDTGVLTFAEGGLQPAELSPLAALVASPASGRARFEGRLDWTAEASTSRGLLTLDDFAFRSPAGAVSGVSGEVDFTSLAPLVTAPGQSLRAARVQAFVPLTEVTATFDLAAESLRLQGAELAAAGGRLRLEPMSIPLAGGVWEGRLHVEGVQLSDLVEASPFGDRVDLDAKVTGVLPFTVTPQGVRVAEGRLAAIQPGRISIRREALTGVSAAGGAATVTEAPAPIVPDAPVPAPPNTITDFAYQAMEHLAFDSLEVTLNSLPEGRLGALFRIEGRHAPPQRQELRLSLFDLLTRRFMQRSLPLPSGTPVNLTLDTTLNLDEVLRDLAASRSGSPPVQPQAPQSAR